MKIIHFVSGVKGGGVESFLINYTSRMNKFNPGIIQYIAYQHNAEKKCLSKLIAAGNVCIEIPDKRKHPIANIVASFRLIRKVRPDIVHCHQSLLNFFPLIAAKLAGVKVRISHSHIAHDNAGPNFCIPLYKKLTKQLATAFVACGHDAGKYLYGNSNFRVVENAIEASRFAFSQVQRERVRNELNASPDAILIGHIGRFVDQKNHEKIVRAFAAFHTQHPTSQLILIGTGPLASSVRKLAVDLKLENSVKFLGAIEDTAPYYSAFDVMLFPSLYEGMPLTLIEAQFAALPIVASSTIDSDVKFTSSTVFMSLDSSDNRWASQMNDVILQKARRETKIVNKDYDINTAYVKLPTMYKSLLAGSN